MGKGKLIYYLILLTTIILPIFSDFELGPSSIDWEVDRIKDSLVQADSINSLDSGLHFDRNSEIYRIDYAKRLDSICKIQEIEDYPTIYRWSRYTLTGFALIFKVNMNSNLLINIITLIFYLWIIVQIILFLLNCNMRFGHQFGIFVSSLLLIIVIAEFTASIIFYIIYAILIYKEIKYRKKYARQQWL